MFDLEGTVQAEVLWADRDGGEAKFTTRFPFSLPLETAFSNTVAIVGLMMPLSDAVPIRITLRYRGHEDDTLTPGLDSNVGRYLALYYSNDVDTEPVFIPSGDLSLLETEGSFAGIRLDMGRPEVVALADALTEALNGTSDPDGGEWGRVLVVGGITL